MTEIRGINDSNNYYDRSKSQKDITNKYPCKPHDKANTQRSYVFNLNRVYSEKLGYLDPIHSKGYFHNYLMLYDAINKSLKSGEDMEVAIKAGGGTTHNVIYVKIKPNEITNLIGKQPYFEKKNDPQNFQVKFGVIRSILADISFRYEQNTELLWGLGNHVASIFRAGTSAFSTEDLTANALGMMCAEEFIKDPKIFMNKYGHNSKDIPETNRYETRARAVNTAIISVAGDVWPEDPSGMVKLEVFGSLSFLPERSSLIKTDDKNNTALDYLTTIEKIRLINGNMPGKGIGWEIEKEEKRWVAALP